MVKIKHKTNVQSMIDSLYLDAASLSTKALQGRANKITEDVIQEIANSPDTYTASGKTYYLSNNGDDTKDGQTIKTAWRSAERLRKAFNDLNEGDAVLFERGGEWRKLSEEKVIDPMDGACGSTSVFIAKKGVYYGAYGTGAKPVLNGSAYNYANPDFWVETEWKNIFRLKQPFPNAGIIAINHSSELGCYDERVAAKEMIGLNGFTGPQNLRIDCSYYCDTVNKILYFCSYKGNPGNRFFSLEIGGRWPIVADFSASCIENFHFKFGGYGITGGPSIRVSHCIFSYIGGCKLSTSNMEPVVCGNAVEIYGNVDEMLIEDCWIYQICDTGLTHQQWNQAGECIHQNISFIGNVIEYCHWSIEFNNPPANDGSTRLSKNYHHSYNILRRGGFGWGSKMFNRTESATLYNCFGTANTIDGVCEKNILNECTGRLYCFRLDGDQDIQCQGNINIQRQGADIANLYDKVYPYTKDGIEYLKKINNHQGSLFFTIE